MDQEILKEIDDGNWAEVFDYANGQKDKPTKTPPGVVVSELPFSRKNVQRIFAIQDGYNDGPDWVVVGQLWDGRFFSLRAGCDYTGWG